MKMVMVTEKVGSWGRREEQREGVMSSPRETVAGNGPVKNRVGTGRENGEIESRARIDLQAASERVCKQ